MRKKIYVFTLIASLFLTVNTKGYSAFGLYSTSEQQTVETVEKILPSVVNISSKVVTKQVVVDPVELLFRGRVTPREMQNEGGSLGSGFVVSSDGYVVTNNHVIEGAVEIQVKFENGKEYFADIIGKDPEADIALLKIRSSDTFTPAQLGDSDAIKLGQSVIAIGNPYGLNNTITTGIVSAKGRSNGVGRIENYIQTDAAINQGNSGGALFSSSGEVIGMNTAIISSTGGNVGIGFAIPINIVKRTIEDLKNHGTVKRGYLGVAFEPNFTEQKARSLGLNSAQGALIIDHIPGSPAAQIGLGFGDVILEVNGKKIQSHNQAMNAIGALRSGEKATLKVWRNRQERTIEVTMGERKNQGQ